VLTIAGGHTLDALCFVLGESIGKDSPDQPAVAATLASGAVVAALVQAGVGPLGELTVPDSYSYTKVQTSADVGFNVAQLYAMIASDITVGTSVAPDFQVALKRHELLDALQKSSDTGLRQTL
jgi:predicted dehydrogenase